MIFLQLFDWTADTGGASVQRGYKSLSPSHHCDPIVPVPFEYRILLRGGALQMNDGMSDSTHVLSIPPLQQHFLRLSVPATHRYGVALAPGALFVKG